MHKMTKASSSIAVAACLLLAGIPSGSWALRQ
jgi:hypothetical protein